MSSLLMKLFWVRLFSTPYPYIGIVVAIAIFTIMIGLFAYWKTMLMNLSFFVLVGVIAGALSCSILSTDTPTDNPKLDNKKLKVIGYTNLGPRIETGRIVTPAGCSFLLVANKRRKNPKPAMEEFVGGGKVLLKWSDEMEGYQIFNEKDEDMSVFLVSRGLVRTKSLASEELRALEREARANRIGIWERSWRGKSEEISWPDYTLIVLFSLALLCQTAIAVLDCREGLCTKY